MKRDIQDCLVWLVNRVVINDQKYADNNIKAENNVKVLSEFYDDLRQHIDFNKLTSEEAIELKFKPFNNNTIYLVPLYLVPLLPEGMELKCITGGTVIVGKDYIDNNTKFGCIAYGITIKENNE